MADAVYRSILSVHFALINAINEKQPGTVTGAVNEDADAKAVRLVKNVEAGRLPETSIQQVLLQALALPLYNEAIYRLWLQRFGAPSGEVDALESFFGISVYTKVKQDLIDARMSL